MLVPSGFFVLKRAKRHRRLTAGLRLRSLPLPPPNPHSVTAVAKSRIATAAPSLRVRKPADVRRNAVLRAGLQLEGEERQENRCRSPPRYLCSLRGPVEGHRQGGYPILKQRRALWFVGILSPPPDCLGARWLIFGRRHPGEGFSQPSQVVSRVEQNAL